MKIGRCLLREVLKSRGISQNKLAHETELTKFQISDYVRGRHIMNLQNAYKIAKTLNCKVEDLYEVEKESK